MNGEQAFAMVGILSCVAAGFFAGVFLRDSKWGITFVFSAAVMAFLIFFHWPAAAESLPTYPDSKLTPGVYDPKITQANIKTTICRSGETKEARHVTEAMKKKVFEEYNLDYSKLHAAYEVDHFIPLCAGGANDLKNLWPQKWSPIPGARQKDRVEVWVHKAICKGKITLDQGREIIKQDWYECFQSLEKKHDCEVIPED